MYKVIVLTEQNICSFQRKILIKTGVLEKTRLCEVFIGEYFYLKVTINQVTV